MPGTKDLNPHELAHKWMKDLETRPDRSGAERRKNCESTKYETIHMASHNFHNFTKFDRSNYDLKCKKSDAWFW